MVPIIGGSRGEISRADGRHLRGVKVKGRRLCVPEAPLAPVDACREQRHRQDDERDAQAQAELGGQGGCCGLGGGVGCC